MWSNNSAVRRLTAAVISELMPDGGRLGILERADRQGRRIERIRADLTDPFTLVLESIESPVEAHVRGKPTLLFGTNSYLGLNFHPDCIAAAEAAIRRDGVGSTASRVAGGTMQGHLELEREVAAFYGRRHATVFSTGFMANLGLITALVGKGDAVFLDAHSHASIVDAAKQSGALVRLFEHDSAQSLEDNFRRSAVPGARTLMVLEGVHSVLGDIADLPALLEVVRRDGAVSVVDEAHALGIYGENGRGACEHLGVEHLADIVVGTFSKSVGVIGGFCVSDLDALRGLRMMARSYIYSASLPPAVVAAARTALSIIAKDTDLRARLWDNVGYMRGVLASRDRRLTGDGPIGSLALPLSYGAHAQWEALLDRGIYVNLLLPPATPSGQINLRVSISAAHRREHLDTAAAALHEVTAGGVRPT